MKKIMLILFIILLPAKVFAANFENLSANEALLRLKAGNRRYAASHMKHPDESKERRYELIGGQHPFVAILSCSDSRVPPEIIFDQGLGDIFVIRNAGNVLDEHVLGSIEYAVEHLGVRLVVVMGHRSCGAVAVTMQGEKSTDAIESLEKSISPACDACKREGRYTYENVIKKHAFLTVENILKDKTINDFVCKHNLKVIPAYYDIKSGDVKFFK